VDTTTQNDAIYIGGPLDGTPFQCSDVALVEVDIDGLVHRYIRTTRERDSLVVYNYDGEIDPNGAEPGVETHRLSGS
jgi:hypothetical protein